MIHHPRLAKRATGETRCSQSHVDTTLHCRHGCIDSASLIVSILMRRGMKGMPCLRIHGGAGEEGGRRDAVDVVIAVYEHQLLVTHCPASRSTACHRQKRQGSCTYRAWDAESWRLPPKYADEQQRQTTQEGQRLAGLSPLLRRRLGRIQRAGRVGRADASVVTVNHAPSAGKGVRRTLPQT